MYYQNYEDYMRSVLGYPVKNQDTYKTIASQEPNYSSMRRQDLNNLEEYYPEIYKEINPLVCKVCNDSRKENINKEILESMVDEVYGNLRINSNNRQNRQNNNLFLRDLIKILILERLLGGGVFPSRPPRPPRPPVRPPFSGGPRQLLTEERMFENDYLRF